MYVDVVAWEGVPQLAPANCGDLGFTRPGTMWVFGFYAARREGLDQLI